MSGLVGLPWGPPSFEVSTRTPASAGATVVAVPVRRAGDDSDDGTAPILGPGGAELADAVGADIAALLETAGATGAAGTVTTLPFPGLTAHLVGVGGASPDEMRRAGAALARSAAGAEVVASSVHAARSDSESDPEAGLTAFVAGLVLGSFRFSMRTEDPGSAPVGRVVLAGGPVDAAVLARAEAIAGAGWLSRALATVPSNVKSPAWLAARAEELAAESGLSCQVWDERKLAADGFGGILAVGRGSASPPRLVRLDYTPRDAGRRTPHVVLVGKGITFDTGGLSIKPAEAMTTMKRDMTGGAVVLATMAALEAVDCPVRVTGLVPMAENAVGGDAMRPGDVITHWGGRTTEVTNTDAEGRLVLADALAYAAAELRPGALVDVATLTGAMKVALGVHLGGYFATDDALAERLAEASATSGERLWRMPLAQEYAGLLGSDVADLDNAPGKAGAITAALFLEAFTRRLPWAHLDIASVGDSPEDNGEWTSGPTGFGPRLLLHWLGSRDPMEGIEKR